MEENKNIEATNQLNSDSLEAVAGGKNGKPQWTKKQRKEVVNDITTLVNMFELSDDPLSVSKYIFESMTYERYMKDLVPELRKRFFDGGIPSSFG